MATGICIYCGRTLDVSQLLDKAGKYRCKNEQDCLDYQTRDDSAASREDPDYLSTLVKSALAEAVERIVAYKAAGDPAGMPGEPTAEWEGMKAALDALAAEYREKTCFAFQQDESTNPEYVVSFAAADRDGHFRIRVGGLAGAGYSLTVARGDAAADPDGLYGEFLHKSYPGDRQEELLKDLSVILVILEGEAELAPARFRALRRELEARSYREDGV